MMGPWCLSAVRRAARRSPAPRDWLRGNGAIIAAAKVLAVELAPRRVNVVSPGMTETEAHAGMDLNARQGMYAAAAAKLPAGRIGKPENLSEAVLFALSNPFMTGAVIDIDGGVHLPRG